MRHFFFLLIFLFLLCPTFSIDAQGDAKLEVPETLDEAKEGVLRIGDKIIEAIPRAIAGLWKNEVVPVWKKMWNWTEEEVWQKRVKPAIETFGDKIKELFGKGAEKQKPLIEQELKEEKQELETDIKTYGTNAGKGLWERFRSLFSDEG